ncbi:MAG TPA: SIS domain-containing protein, partial [Terracidiphilus sp.]|nr:SIS domain-containing protein [Terracidiphilus sp.]
AYVGDNIGPMLEAVRQAVSTRKPCTLRNGFIIGCGDSYCAALAARLYMTRAIGHLVEPVEALEFSRYLVNHLPENSFVFGVSNSGAVSRTIEGVRLSRERGAWTFAVTVSGESNLGKAAETLIKVNATPNIKEQADGTRVITPGTITYTASMLGLYVAGIAIGEHIGHLNAEQVKALVAELHALPGIMERAAAAADEIAGKIAETFTIERKTVILGGGPNYATAYFGMAKWFEAMTRPCHVSELEEWAHEHYFMTDEKTDTIVVLPPGAGNSRGLEQAWAARQMKSRVIVIGQEDDDAAKAASDIYFPMPSVSEALSPFVYKLPFEYLSCYIAGNQNIPFLDFDNPRRQEVNFKQIFNSVETAARKSAAK